MQPQRLRAAAPKLEQQPRPSIPVEIRRARASDVAAVAKCWFEAYYDDPGTTDLSAEYLAERTLEKFVPRVAERVPDTLIACAPSGKVIGLCVARENEVSKHMGARSTRLL